MLEPEATSVQAKKVSAAVSAKQSSKVVSAANVSVDDLVSSYFK
jgi:hypothetical protein